MPDFPSPPSTHSDSALAELARAGDTRAFAELWRRHVAAGTTAARQFAAIADPDDIVSEAYLRILRSLQRGGGPHEAFRPYLYRTIRNIAMDWRVSQPSVPLEAAPEIESPDSDPEITVLDNVVTARAFREIPERWQAVLWYLDVEGMAPADAAPMLGLSPNATSALAVRAREGFKKAWLQAHVSDLSVPPECRWTTERMAQYVRGGLTGRSRQRFDRHLETCTRCSILIEEIDDLGGHLAGVLLPAALGGPAAAALLGRLSSEGGAPTTSTAGISRRTIATASAGALALVLLATGAVAVTASWDAPVAPAADEAPPPPVSPPPAIVPTAGESTASESEPEPIVPPPAAPPRPVAPRPDTTAPSAPSVLLPADGTLTNASQPSISGVGEPGARVEVRRLDGASLSVILAAVVGADGTWSGVPSQPLADGTVELRVSQVDATGNRSPEVVRLITVDTIALPPVVDALDASPMRYLPEVTGVAEPGATVILTDQGSSTLGTAIADIDGRWTIPLPDPLTDGSAVSATQLDLAGNLSAASPLSTQLSFTRPDLVAPGAGALIPSTGGSTVVTVEIAGDEGYRVQVFIDGTGTGNLHTLEATPIVRVTPALADGVHTIGVRYFDPVTGRPGSMRTIQITIG